MPAQYSIPCTDEHCFFISPSIVDDLSAVKAGHLVPSCHIVDKDRILGTTKNELPLGGCQWFRRIFRYIQNNSLNLTCMNLQTVDIAVGVSDGVVLEPKDGIVPLVPKDLAVLG